MTDFSKQILKEFQTRKTKKQKTRFIRLLQSHFPQLRVEKGGLSGSRNLILGDPEQAKVVLSAHYDTCAALPFPNFNTPKMPIVAIFYSILIALPAIFVMFAVNALVVYLFRDPLLVYISTLVVYLLYMWLLLGGPACHHTANDNTSGVITLLEIYERMPEALRQQTCFVFFDNEEKGLIGSGQFRKKYKKQMKDKLLINFDCVSDGDNIMIAASKKANRSYHVAVARAYRNEGSKKVLLEKLNKIYYPSDQAGFPVAIAVAALNYKKPFGYYMDKIHTKRDRVFDEENIRYLAEHTLQLIESI